MIRAEGFDGRNIALFGLSRSGKSCARSLAQGGARVLAWDDAKAKRRAARADGIPLADLAQADWADIDALVLSPGVPLTHPAPHWTVEMARAAGTEIIGDMELFMRALHEADAQRRFIGITGTNGKSTTTAMLGHVLRHGGLDAGTGGNIGTPVLDLAAIESGAVYVIELSSYQIDLSPGLKPHVGILLNLSPDHLDRHGTFEHYVQVKAALFANQGPNDFAIIGVDGAACEKIAETLETKADIIPISATKRLERGVFVENAVLFDCLTGRRERVGDMSLFRSVRGVHNWQNAAAVYAAARVFGLKEKTIFDGLESFGGLEHRMEEVARLGEIVFINDSKATNGDAAAYALASFDDILWIAGGQAKTGGIAGLKPWFGRIRKAYLIGEAADDFAATLGGAVPVDLSGTVERAIETIMRDIADRKSGKAVVLFSPACASFDQYPDFEARGDAFKAAVERVLQGENVG